MHNTIYMISEKPIINDSFDIDDTWFVREICDWYDIVKYKAASHFADMYFSLSPKFEHEGDKLTVTFPEEMLKLWRRCEYKSLSEAIQNLYEKVSDGRLKETFINGGDECLYDVDVCTIQDVALGIRYGDYVMFKDEIMPMNTFLRVVRPNKKYYISHDIIDYNW